ncbi:hypothetical protein FBUS_10118 [Fasciolopsis buskii]|uniref:Uncharacterized protein n=1 Tax=Fasciolopsis buskii TaxID=27845 RepID=A0A8E0VJM1_9TREM|nr:hypothetical protein FBUS_10118 [Fasciolopsis buski]
MPSPPSSLKAFSEKQRSLTASWRQQMFNLLDTAPFQSTSDPSRSSRSIPRSYHGGRPFRKPPCRHHPRSKRGTITCSALTVHDTPTLPHLLFQRSTVLPDSATSLECTSVPPGLSDLHQTSSLQTPSNPYLCTIGVSRPMRNELDPMPTISPLSRTSLAPDGTSFPLVPHEHSGVSQAFFAIEGSGYHLLARDPQPNSVHMVSCSGSVATGSNATSSHSHPDWTVSVAGRQYNVHPMYAARDPCTLASLVPTIPSETDTGTKFIEHNLDLLTRKVTELAIGG